MPSILTPLLITVARLMLARGVLFPAFAEAMKGAYLSAARNAEGAKLTDSHLSLATGLQRRDIVRLQTALSEKSSRPNHLAILVARWQVEDGYNHRNTAMEIAQSGPAPSFEALAKSVRQDVHPRTMLDALEAAGTVQVLDGTVVLKMTSYQPAAGSDEQLEYLALNVSGHLSAATENLMGSVQPHFDRAVHYSHLSADAVTELRAFYEREQQQVLEAVNARAAELQMVSNGQMRFRAGGYFYDHTQSEETL